MNLTKLLVTPALKRRLSLSALITIAGLAAVPPAQAASETWTNAPVSGSWTNILNWNAQAVPGKINATGNSPDGDIATFTNPIPASGIGGATAPVTPDDATISGDRARNVLGLTFDGPDCGAYVVNSTSVSNYPSTGILWVSHNGAIRMNAPVTNTETILEPMYVILPSSTAGIFNLVNNSANPNAAMIINSITHGGANTRATTFILDGTNSALNIVTNLSEGISTASSGGFTKQGSSTWMIAGAGKFPAGSPLNINNGKLIVQDPGAFGLATTATINSNAVLQINGVNLTTSTLTLQRSGTLSINGSATLAGVTVGTAAVPTTPTLATTSSSDVMTLGNAANKVTGGVASSLLHVTGPGTVLLPYGNNYAGSWSVDAGTLQLGTGAATALGTGVNLNIGSGGTLDLSVETAGGGTYNPTTSGIGGSGTGTVVGSTAATIKADPAGIIDLGTGTKTINLTFTPASITGDLAHPALYISAGTLSLNGNAFAINNASGTPLGAGTYQLILQASGAITSGSGYSVIGVTGAGLAAGDVASIAVNGSEVDLVVAAYTPQSLVWSGTGSVWDIATTSDWLDGGVSSLFHNSDDVTFNAVGAANPSVTLASVLSPASVLVSNTAAYTFTGSGSIAGGAALTKTGSGTLTLSTVNTYSGGTVVNNGVLQFGVANALPDIAGDVSVQSPGVLDLNGNSGGINALTGNGTVDTVAGGTAVLAIGDNNDGGTFSGVIQNTAGTLGLTKMGNGVETLTGANTYTGPTVVNAGTLAAANPAALGNGASAVTVSTSSTLALNTGVSVASLSGAGTVLNNAASGNTLTILGGGTFNGNLTDGGGGALSLLVLGTTVLQLNNGGNTFSGGLTLAAGAGVGVGPGGAAGTGGILVSNGASLAANSGGSAESVIANNITTVSGATAHFYGAGAGGNSYTGQFIGDATTTNVFHGQLSFAGGSPGAPQFSNDLGVVQFVPSANGIGTRIYTALNTFINGGDNTTFDFEGGYLFNRDAQTYSLGAITGGVTTTNLIGGGISSPSFGPATFLIGAKGNNCVFSGSISGSNNIVKQGAGVLTLNGAYGTVVTSPDGGLTYNTNLALVNTLINYLGYTTISNGTLQLIAPVVLTNSPTVTLASPSAVLDASQMGAIATDGATYTNLVTNGVFEVVSGQTLSGEGTIITSNLLLDAGASLNVGLPTGSLTATLGATLGGTINMTLNAGTRPLSSELISTGTITVSGATLVVTNAGGSITNGTTFQLFNQPVTGFGFVTLPLTDPTTAATYVWQNALGTNGSITLLSGGAAPFTPGTNASLASLAVSTTGALTPAFTTNGFTYAATEVYAGAPTVTPTSADPNATITLIYGGVTNPITSGTTSAPLTLNADLTATNLVDVEVTAQDGVTVLDYFVAIKQQPSLTQPTLARVKSAGALQLSWPLDHVGYRLLEQTNNLSHGISTNASDWGTVSGSTTTNLEVVPINASQLNEYYQLVYP